jgi:hypothetical protein
MSRFDRISSERSSAKRPPPKRRQKQALESEHPSAGKSLSPSLTKNISENFTLHFLPNVQDEPRGPNNH